MTELKLNEVVSIVMTKNDIFEWQESCTFEGVLLRVPAGEGDNYEFDIGGVIVRINGTSPEFVATYQKSTLTPANPEVRG